MPSLKRRWKVAIGGGMAGLALLAVTAVPTFAQQAPTPTPTTTPNGVPTHQQVDAMMDAAHGQGAAQRMRAAMGPNADKQISQCVSMMGTSQAGSGMMGGQAATTP